MQKKWVYRLIMSYVPIFFVVIFCLMLLFFFSAGEMTKKQSQRASSAFAAQVLQMTDSTLRGMDTFASKNLLLNEKVRSYFQSDAADAPYGYYQVTEAVRDFMEPQPMIDSVYLYRQQDHKVLMQNFSAELGSFGDRDFIAQAMQAPGPYLWSGIRQLHLFPDGEAAKPVISLVKKVPYYSGEQGLIVINIHASSLSELLREVRTDGGADLCLSDRAGRSVAGTGASCGGAETAEADAVRQVSAYTGWTLRTQLAPGGAFAAISAMSYVWLALGLAVVVGGIAAMTYISHRHYRPLEQILGRIQSVADKQNQLVRGRGGEDEFAFIEHSLESLIERTNSYEKQQAEGLLYRRTHFYKEALEGTRTLTTEAWASETAQLGFSGAFEGAIVAVVELDGYAAFASAYSERDLALFKFTLRSMLQEMAEEADESLWTEWLAPHRLGLLYQMPLLGGERQRVMRIRTLSEQARAWLAQYLKFTVTFGIGETAAEVNALPQSYRQATLALERKFAHGPNGVFVYDPRIGAAAAGLGVNTAGQELQETAQLFRSGNPDWTLLFNQSFETMRSGLYSREELTAELRLFRGQLQREMLELPAEYREQWRLRGQPLLDGLPDDFEWLEDARLALLAALEAADEPMQTLRLSREQYTLAARVKAYVAERYADPELSLSHVSDAFQTNTKTLSRIFKEEIGEKFIDYLARVRMDHARQLLLETATPVQTVGEQVGYVHTMSFIRAFKKVVGTTPGDFRKERSERQA